MNNWISVKDRLPEYNKGVLVYSETYGVLYYYLRALDNLWVQDGIDTVSDSVLQDITHWQNLPEPPKQENQ